ncbi:hypothetical protein [Methylobacterium sp. ID0610]|uniref:hypothetical protein n=1 Tax=Methylobacterium carpenticola TaxID=3344827 RepID=UPI0036C60468
MTRLGNPLVYSLPAVAETLSQAPSAGSDGHAALRRAVSTAYDAVLHALCCVCADALVGWSRRDTMGAIDRSRDHGPSKSRLASAEAKALLGPQAFDVGANQARQTITIIEALDRTQRMKLAVPLIAKPRSR